MNKREPDFENLLKVLRREKPARPVLFELFMDHTYYERATGRKMNGSELDNLRVVVDAFAAYGYDYATMKGSAFLFPKKTNPKMESISLNGGAIITDWESFEAYPWPNPNDFSNDRLEKIVPYMPEGMKLMCSGPGGILENLIELTGYENLCLMLYDEPELVEEIVNHIGERFLTYYETAVQYDSVGLLCCNDDWGFNTQTMLSPHDMRKYIFPWHKRIVELAHKHNKPCILHSCGYFGDIIEELIEDIKFDARHSYEDNIMPVEEFYEQYGSRIATLGGIDIGFLCRETPENITKRCRAMLERTADRGGYALGTGNSVPAFVPFENYLAMVRAAWDCR